jgi:enterochelin esterase-like enzyme
MGALAVCLLASMAGGVATFAELQADLVRHPSGGDERVRSFIRRAGGTPVVEGTTVFFLAEGDPERPPRLRGDFNGWAEGENPAGTLERLGGTRFFFRRVELPLDARVEYVLVTPEGEKADPENPRQVEGFQGWQSELAMPAYRPVVDPADADRAARGRVVSFEHESARLSNKRRVHVYLPHGYDPQGDRRYPEAWLGDGTSYVEKTQAPRLLDSLIASRRLEPVVAILVDPVDRRVEYGLHVGFRRMMLEELVPRISHEYRVEGRAERRLVAGGSRGGQAALDLCLAAPDVFGLCGAWAPAIAPRSVAEFLGGRRGRGRFVLLRARYDEDFGPDAPALGDALRAQGARVDPLEAPQGHNLGSWPDFMARVLLAVFPGPTPLQR